MPIDCNWIINGRFNGSDNWSLLGGAEYSPSIGEVDDQGVTSFGSARLFGAGQSIEQLSIYLPRCPNFTFSFGYRAAGAGQLQISFYNSDNDPVINQTIAVIGNGVTWSNYSQVLGLLEGTYNKIVFAWVNIEIYLDNISLAHIPMTKLKLAQETANTLGNDLTVGISPPVSEDDLGDYTQAVDEGLRWVEAINSQREADPRCLDPDRLADCLDQILQVMATGKVLNYFQTLTDTTLGSRSERFSQIARSIREQYGLVAGGTDKIRRRFTTVPLLHSRPRGDKWD